jgi:hypothetical protein
MRRADHHLFHHDVVAEPGRGEPLPQLVLAVRERRDLAHVRIDHRRAEARELAGLEQVLDDVDLRAFAVQLEVDLVAVAHMLVQPVRRAYELRRLARTDVGELVGEHARADAADVVQLVRRRAVPQPVTADANTPVADALERRPARGCRLEAIDPVEAVLRVADGIERLALVCPDIQEDLQPAGVVACATLWL